MIQNLQSFLKLLNLSFPSAKAKFLWQAIFRVILSFTDLVGIAILLSIMSIVVESEKIDHYAKKFNHFFQVNLDYKTLISTVLFICICFFILKNALIYYIQVKGILFAEKVSLSLSDQQIKVFYQRGYSYLLNNRVHKTSFKAGNYPFDFANSSIRSAFNLITELAILIAFLLLAFYSNTILAIILFVLTVPLSWLMYAKLSRTANRIGKNRNNLAPKTHEKLHQLFENYIEMKVYNGLAFFKMDFLKSLESFNHARFTQQKVAFVPKKFLEIVAVFLIVFLFLIHIYMIGNVKTSLIFDLGLLGIYGYKVMPAIGQVIEALITLKIGENAQNDLLKNLLQYKPNKKESIPIAFKESISLKNISLKIAEFEILKNISLHFKKGQIIGIIGASGSGKSTLSKIILGIIKPTSGIIAVDEKNTDLFENDNWLQTFGYISQDSTLLNAGIYENVCYSFAKSDDIENIEKALELAQLSEFIGGNKLIGEKGNLLSTGQKQRLALARALYFKKPNLLLDEFSSNLDNATEKPLLSTIEKINKTEKTTVVLIAHKESTLAIAHVIFKLENGEITRVK